jgi:plasmid maintenance system antidote protein VapI
MRATHFCQGEPVGHSRPMVARKRLTNEQFAAIVAAPETMSDTDLARQLGCHITTVNHYRDSFRRVGWFCEVHFVACMHCGKTVSARNAVVPRQCAACRREAARVRTQQWDADHRKPPTEPPGLTTAQVAERFEISRARVQSLVARGQLQVAVTTALRWYFDPLEVERCAEARKVRGDSPYWHITPGLLSRREVAERLQRSRRRVDQLIDNGKLVPIDATAFHLLFDAAQVEQLAAMRPQIGKPTRPWTEDEDRVIVRDPKRSVRLIAIELGRSATAVSQRRRELRARQGDQAEPRP